jgi:PAS domain-containing protein
VPNKNPQSRRPVSVRQGRAHQSSRADRLSVAELATALSTLRATTAELRQSKKQLQQINRWFHVALNNMGRGLSMFDAEVRLIVCNRLYGEFYGIPGRLTRPGTTLR